MGSKKIKKTAFHHDVVFIVVHTVVNEGCLLNGLLKLKKYIYLSIG